MGIDITQKFMIRIEELDRSLSKETAARSFLKKMIAEYQEMDHHQAAQLEQLATYWLSKCEK